MKTELYIISGFLGAGKTTLIQKLLAEAFSDRQVAIVENDFGDISIDAALLQSGGIQVKELSAGCICCSLAGDFVKALGEVLETYHPEVVLIEPSGVGKLSDVMRACEDPYLQDRITLGTKITVVDANRCKMFLQNFGAFFEDQVRNADVVLLSRAEAFPKRAKEALSLLQKINTHALILGESWDKISVATLLSGKKEPCTCGHSHHDPHAHHGHACHCHAEEGHCHDTAEDVFDTVTIRTDTVFDTDMLAERIAGLAQIGEVLRAKGIVRGKQGYLQLQYVPGELAITDCTTQGDALCFIGQGLNRPALMQLFGGV